MSDNVNIRKVFVLKFTQAFVNIVNHIILSGFENDLPKTEHTNDLLKPLAIFLERYKMEMYFLFAEELARFGKELSDESLKELFESMVNDLKEDAYDQRVFSWYCVVLSYYAAVARRRAVDKALKTAVLTIMEAILHFEKDDKVKGDIIEGIKDYIKETAKLIEDQKSSSYQ